jgi:hypothetical protein
MSTSGEGLQVIGASAIASDLATKSCRPRGIEVKGGLISMKATLFSRRGRSIENVSPRIDIGASPIPCKVRGFAITLRFITMGERLLAFRTSLQPIEAKVISLVARSLSTSPRPMLIGAKTIKSTSRMIALGARMQAIARCPLAIGESFISIAGVPVHYGAVLLEGRAIPG